MESIKKSTLDFLTELKCNNNRDWFIANRSRYLDAIDGEKLKTAPKGYPANHPYIELLKFKSYLVVNEVPDKMVISNDFIDHVVNVFKAMKPLNDYLNN